MDCVNLTDKAVQEQYDLELVLRFLVFREMPDEALKSIGDLDDFLTHKMREMAVSRDYDRLGQSRAFERTFDVLASTTKGDTFRRYDLAKRKFVGGFLVSAFEAVALGVGFNVNRTAGRESTIPDKVKSLWQMNDFVEGSGSGIRASTRIPRIVPLGRRLFA